MTGAIACPACTLRCAYPAAAEPSALVCPRCAAPLRHRKPHSIQKTWALLLSAAFLYIPANTLPVMTITNIGQSQPNTILQGIIELFQAGMWEVGALVFVASITVPLLKIVSLAYLLLSTRRRHGLHPKEQTRLYRLIEYIGRWSMIDMFMLSILVALVQLGWLATVEPGPGAVCFATVVILTMFAASSFDPRLIWDNPGGER
ncbi:MAG: paraquat-inducible protein A [Myxococcota bacterium]|jgi:paraquat-inducible protein A